jgi:lysyl-tRNA synthetase class 1
MDGLRKIPRQPAQPGDAGGGSRQAGDQRARPVRRARELRRHNNARLRAFLDGFGFDYEFVSATDCYPVRAGSTRCCCGAGAVRRHPGDHAADPGRERRATYSPFLPISPKTGRVLQVPTLERHVDRGTIVFRDEDGALTEVPVTGGHVKLQWRPDWAARWTALGVDYEMSGKDLIDSVRVSATGLPGAGRRAAGGLPLRALHGREQPEDLQVQGQRPDHGGLAALRRAESLAYYMFQSPRRPSGCISTSSPRRPTNICSSWTPITARRPRGQRAQPARQSGVERPRGRARRPRARRSASRLLLNLVSAANASDKAILWGFLSRYIPGATPQSEPMLDRLAGYAINYYEDFVRPAKRFRAPDERERAAFADLLARLRALPAGCQDAERIQNEVYAAGKDRRVRAPARLVHRPSMKCCWARARARASAPSRRSSAWPHHRPDRARIS